MYTCGPTVYNYAHIGNFRTFVFEDVLRRYLEHKGYSVIQVKNITDVEDRIIEGIKRTGKSLQELTDFYTKAFMEDLDTLNIQKAEHYPRATENIDEIVDAVEVADEEGLRLQGGRRLRLLLHQEVPQVRQALRHQAGRGQVGDARGRRPLREDGGERLCAVEGVGPGRRRGLLGDDAWERGGPAGT